jgi:hypothetical protein
MGKEDFIQLVKKIVSDAKHLKDTFTEEAEAPVNYACIFCQNEAEFDEFSGMAKEIGGIFQETPTGPLFKTEPIDTDSGQLELLKVRRPDETRKERGDADFTVKDYSSFKAKYISKPRFKLIERADGEMIELTAPDATVRVYFSEHPLDKNL